jgi:hypothetical protein
MVWIPAAGDGDEGRDRLADHGAAAMALDSTSSGKARRRARTLDRKHWQRMTTPPQTPRDHQHRQAAAFEKPLAHQHGQITAQISGERRQTDKRRSRPGAHSKPRHEASKGRKPVNTATL